MSFKKHLTYSVVLTSLTLTCVASFVSSDYGIGESNVVYAESQDQNQSTWASPYINAMRDGDLLPASLSNTDLTKNISREEFAELMTTYVNKVGGVAKTNPGVKFSDTTNPLVIQSAELGIVEGMGNNKFAPKQITNREQIATMAYRGEKLVRPNIVTQKNTTLFKDGRQVSEWAKEGVGTMQAEKVIEGVGGGYFKPKDTATREQAIKIVSELAAKRGLVTIDRPVTPASPTPQNPVSSKPAAGSVPLNKWGIPQNPKPTPKTIAGFTPDFRVLYSTKNPSTNSYFTVGLKNSMELPRNSGIQVSVTCVSHPQLNKYRTNGTFTGNWVEVDRVSMSTKALSSGDLAYLPKLTPNYVTDLNGKPIVIKEGEIIEYKITLSKGNEKAEYTQYVQHKDKVFSN